MTSAPPMQYPPAVRPPSRQQGSGLAITSLVLALVGFFMPVLPPIAIILAVIALLKGTASKGLAIAGVIVAALIITLHVAILIPALSEARRAAMQVKSGAQLRAVGQGLVMYSMDHGSWYPERGADWEQRLISTGRITPAILTSPGAQPGQQSYFYIPGYQNKFDSDVIIAYENIDLPWNGGHVFYDDGRVEFIPGAKYEPLFTELERLRTGQ